MEYNLIAQYILTAIILIILAISSREDLKYNRITKRKVMLILIFTMLYTLVYPTYGIERTAAFLIAFIMFFVLLLLTRKEMPSGKYLAPVFILSAFLFCYCVLVANPQLILQKLLVLLGNYAYSLYLFHLPFFQLLCAIGIITYGSIASLLYTVLLSPILVMLCILIEKSLNSMASLFIALCVRQRDIHDTKSQGEKGDSGYLQS